MRTRDENKRNTMKVTTRKHRNTADGIMPTPKSSTRVCIKNLPAHLTELGLREYLQHHLAISGTCLTDCRILKHPTGKSRRMAFCGFLKPSQADECVQKLHRAYCQSCRLVVEYAVLPQVNKETNETDKDLMIPSGSDKQTGQEEKESGASIRVDHPVDRQKEEFLAVMGAGRTGTQTKRKFWANDDEDGNEPNSHDILDGKASDDDDEQDSSTDAKSSGPEKGEGENNAPIKSDLDFLMSKRVEVDDLESEDVRINEGSKAPDHDCIESNHSTSDDSEKPELPTEPVTDTYPQDTRPENKIDADNATGNRLFLRNLPFSATEDDIREHFQSFGAICECHVPVDDLKRSKGFGFVTFESAQGAKAAMAELDGTDFQGRILHIIPAKSAPSQQNYGNEQNGTYKSKVESTRQENAASKTAGWSASFVRTDAVVDNLASRLGLAKGDILAVKDGLSGGDAAVRLALGETAIIEENRKYFDNHGYDMDALVSPSANETSSQIARSKTAILVKNLPFDTSMEDLAKLFSSPTPKRILLSPSRTLAVVEYTHGNDAKVAFRRLAYKRFKSVPLYLEWAPLVSIKEQTADPSLGNGNEKRNNAATDDIEADEFLMSSSTSTLYVKNLNFVTTEETLHAEFSKYFKDIRSVRIPVRSAPMKRSRMDSSDQSGTVETSSMGYGFIEFGSKESAQKAVKMMNGRILEGHALEVKLSERNENQTKTVSSTSNKKLLVRNVPFQATRKDLLQLFGSFGQLRQVRLPRKFDGTNRGFAFVEFVLGKEAAAAMNALAKTHLYGRHLVIEWAATDEEANDIEGLRKKAEKNLNADPISKKMRTR